MNPSTKPVRQYKSYEEYLAVRLKEIAAKSKVVGDCIEWTGARVRTGYGTLSFNGRRGSRIHRVIWAIHNGPIPEGMVICHKCDNPPCFKLEHLFMGTIRENSQDMMRKKRNFFQNKTHCPQGHEYTEKNTIRQKTKSGFCRYCRTCVYAARNARVRKNRANARLQTPP